MTVSLSIAVKFTVYPFIDQHAQNLTACLPLEITVYSNHPGGDREKKIVQSGNFNSLLDGEFR